MSRHDERVALGRGGLEVSRLGLGTAALGGLYSSVSQAAATGLVTAAVGAGIRYLDTAPQYGHGVAEQRLGRALAVAGRPPVVLSTKVGRLLVDTGEHVDKGLFADAAPLQPVFDFSADAVRRSLAGSLERLGVDVVDIVLLHDPDDHEREALDGAYPALHRLRAEGVVRSIGIGTNSAPAATRFVRQTDLDVVLIAGRFTLLDQQAQEELLPVALARDVSVVAAGVFNSGLLADPRPGAPYDYRPAPEPLVRRATAVRDLLRDAGVPLTAAALQFPLRHPAVRVVLTGARSAAELLSTVQDVDREVPDDCWRALEDSGLLPAVPG